MKSVARCKFIHIGLNVVDGILKHISLMKCLKNVSVKVMVIESLLLRNQNFRSVLVRNVQMSKNQSLQEAACKIKSSIAAIFEQIIEFQSDNTREICYELILGLLGPNSFYHFSVKKNQFPEFQRNLPRYIRGLIYVIRADHELQNNSEQ